MTHQRLRIALLATPLLMAAGGWDGTYAGRITLVGAGAPACAKNAPVQMTVSAGNKLEYHHFSNVTFNVTVNPDGSFSGTEHNLYTAGRGSTMIVQDLTGRITGTQIEADTKSQYCNYHLSLKRMQ